MTKKDCIARATLYLTRQGYAVEWSSRNGIDLISRKDGITAFTAVAPFRRKYFPLCHFKGSKARESRFNRLTAGVNKWLVEKPYKGQIRLDSVYVADDGRIDHTFGAPYRVGAF